MANYRQTVGDYHQYFTYFLFSIFSLFNLYLRMFYSKDDSISHPNAHHNGNAWLKCAAVAKSTLDILWMLTIASSLMVQNHYRPNKHYWWQLSDNSVYICIVVLSVKTCRTCICTRWRHSQSPPCWWWKEPLAVIQCSYFKSWEVCDVAFTMSPIWRSLRVWSVHRPSVHSQILNRSENASSTRRFLVLLSVNALHLCTQNISVWCWGMRFGTQLLSS